ncbi:MAG TPA: FkbM family methyltransferase [Jatrophihabitantaceae bacterium]|jgi:FkbM family methyltransferase
MAGQVRGLAWQAAVQLRAGLNRAGLDVSRDHFRSRFVAFLHDRGIDTVLDVGANTGQFGQALRRAKFRGQILSVEPLSAAYAQLVERASEDADWDTERAAISDRPGMITMNVSGNSVSSSVLPMLDRHADAAPASRYVSTEQVPATTVDELMRRHQLRAETTLLKIDVQGYEKAVLDGAGATLPRIAGVKTELSLVPLYDGQALLTDMIDYLARSGLELWMIEPGFADPKTHRLLQLDGLFFPA